MEKVLAQIVDVVEDLDWSVTLIDDEFEFEKTSPAGEDFSFCAEGKTIEELRHSIYEYADSFDEEEHIRMWMMGDTSGVPDCATLCQDAKDIHSMLWELENAIGNIED